MPQIRTVAEGFTKQLLINILKTPFFVKNFFPISFLNLWENFFKTSGRLSKLFPKKSSSSPNTTNRNVRLPARVKMLAHFGQCD